MNITLLPHQEKAIEAAISAGVIHSVEELIDTAIAHLPPTIQTSSPKPAKGQSLVDVCAMVRGLTEDVDFSRNPSTGRPVDLA